MMLSRHAYVTTTNYQLPYLPTNLGKVVSYQTESLNCLSDASVCRHCKQNKTLSTAKSLEAPKTKANKQFASYTIWGLANLTTWSWATIYRTFTGSPVLIISARSTLTLLGRIHGIQAIPPSLKWSTTRH